MQAKSRQNTPFRGDRVMRYVNDSGAEMPLMEFISARRPDSKRGDIKKWLRFGHLAVDGHVTNAFNAPVGCGAEVTLNLSRPFPVFRHPRIEIVYEDDHVLVINKGYGILSVRTPVHKNEESAFDIMRDYVKKVDPRQRLYVVHRLDRDTSGLMMFAKSEEAQNVLRHNWNNMILERLYVAVLEGDLEQDKGFVKSRLTENSRFVVYSTENPEEGRVAVTHYEVKARGNGYTLATFSLDTGRKNQIRVHASEMGHPIAGDRKYGAHTSPIHRLALHAMTLRFAHPVTHRDMNFQTPVPPKFASMVGGFRKRRQQP